MMGPANYEGPQESQQVVKGLPEFSNVREFEGKIKESGTLPWIVYKLLGSRHKVAESLIISY